MVRTREFDPAIALSRAVELFSSKGYSDTSMDDIVKATGVSRYGLYGTFGNKRDLFEQALESYADNMGRDLFMRLLEPDASISDLQAIFEARIEQRLENGEYRGCMLAHTAMELAPQDREIEEVLQKFLGRMTKAFSIGLDNAKNHGEVRGDLDTRVAGEFLTGALFGLDVLARSGFPRDTLDRFIESTLSSLAV